MTGDGGLRERRAGKGGKHRRKRPRASPWRSTRRSSRRRRSSASWSCTKRTGTSSPRSSATRSSPGRLVVVAGALLWLLLFVIFLRAYRTQKRTNDELVETQDVTIFALAYQAELRDRQTGKHLERTAIYVRILAEELARLPQYRAYLTPDLHRGPREVRSPARHRQGRDRGLHPPEAGKAHRRRRWTEIREALRVRGTGAADRGKEAEVPVVPEHRHPAHPLSTTRSGTAPATPTG